jgi:hypothetical protein
MSKPTWTVEVRCKEFRGPIYKGAAHDLATLHEGLRQHISEVESARERSVALSKKHPESDHDYWVCLDNTEL